MLAHSTRWIPILAASELRRELVPLLSHASAAGTADDVARLWDTWPAASLDPLWATDAAGLPMGFASAAATIVAENVPIFAVARSAAHGALLDGAVDPAPLDRLCRGEPLPFPGALAIPFDDRRFPSVAWIADLTTMAALGARIRNLADASVPVLVSGESGTGKELVARALHRFSRRAQEPWLALNCAELAEGTIESELFGHRRGAFTGAVRDRDGLLAAARGGTVFLDEIGELSLAAQAKLLRVVEEHRVRPLGAEAARPIDCRVVAATNRDLATAATMGRFRADLLYRLRGAEIELHPLRARPRDLASLADTFVVRATVRHGRRIRGLAADARVALAAHDWPGNVRELRQVLEAAVLCATEPWIHAADLAIVAGVKVRPTEPLVTVRALERAHLLRALEATAGKRGAAAELLGLSRQSLARRLRRHGLDPVPREAALLSNRR